jgi:predicted  nucleic acid-binding Zn-ribbon protein
MKHLSFRVIFFCVFLPPVLYIFSIKGLEVLLQRWWSAELQGILISDTSALMQGQVRIEDQIRRNIDQFLAERTAIRWGASPRITVRTATGRLLYPPIGPVASPGSTPYPRAEEMSAPSTDPLQAARENMKVMEEGLTMSLSVEIPNNTWIANSVLVSYILTFSLLLFGAYRRSAKSAESLALESQEALEAATSRLEEAELRLTEVSGKEIEYREEIERLRGEVSKSAEKLRTTEDEALTEIETLEKKLHGSTQLRESVESDVLRLKEELERLESSRKVSAKKATKQVDSVMKRFRTLYKSLEFDPRAVEGFLHLEGDLQLKAEECIHNLNEDSSRLAVRRKVFSGKGALPVLESDFAYKGRIYWRREADGKTRVLAIGTKNTQAKDLAYLETLEKQAGERQRA